MIKCWRCYKFLHSPGRRSLRKFVKCRLDKRRTKGKLFRFLSALFLKNIFIWMKFTFCQSPFISKKENSIHCTQPLILSRLPPYNNEYPFNQKRKTLFHTQIWFLCSLVRSPSSFFFLSILYPPTLHLSFFALDEKKNRMFHHHKLTNFYAINLHTWAAMAYTQSHSYLIWH